MPFDLSELIAKPRTVNVPGVGVVMVREPTMADYARAPADPYWWGACITCTDGSPFVVNHAELGNIRAEICSALLEEINKPSRPTQAPSAGSGALQMGNEG